MATFTAAVVQLRSGTEPARNIEAIDALVRAAASDGATYIQTPEMSGLVQADRKAFFATIREQDADPLVAHAAGLAKELGVTLHIGSTPIKVADDRAANRAFVFGPDGDLRTTYDKIHMFDVDLDNGERWRESAVYRPGGKAVAVDIAGAKLGLAICYDLRFPALLRSYADAGCTMLSVPSCFTRQTGQAHWHVLLRARAIENGAWVVAAAQGGEHEDGRTTYGHSLIVDPWGKVVAELADEGPGYALAEIDTDAATAARNRVPNLANVVPFELPQHA